MTLRHLSVSAEEALRALIAWGYWLGLGFALLVIALFGISLAHAHDSWISRGSYKNGGGEWCCGDTDCKAYAKAESTAQGWLIEGELVPYDEALPIAPPDGQVTVCRRPDGSRRCVFGLKPGL